jgi:hypothetical protein
MRTLFTCRYFLESKGSKREAAHSLSSSAEVLNARNFNSQGQLLNEVGIDVYIYIVTCIPVSRKRVGKYVSAEIRFLDTNQLVAV